MVQASPSLRIRVTYNKNKFFKLPLRASETGVVTRICQVCGGTLEPLVQICDATDAVVLERGACAGCGFVTFSRMPDGDWFEDFYRSGWDRNRGEESIQDKIEAPYEPLLELLTPLVNDGSRVLEIGAGYGGALNRLRDMGVKTLRGIEASAKRQQVCRDQLGLDVSLVTAEKMETLPAIAEAAPYDVVYSWHVIEHVVDLDRTFAAVARLVRPGGKFVIGVPHVEHEHIVYMAHFLPHIHCFTPYGMTVLLARHGFEVEHIDDKISVVARRAEGPVTVPAPPAGSDFPAMFAAKVARDLDLARLATGNPFLLDYRVLMFRDSSATAHPVAEMRVGERMAFLTKRLAIGCGHNLRPVLHPQIQPFNALDPANAAHWLAAHTVRFADMECGGVLDKISQIAPPSRMPLVQVVYPARHGYAWIK